MANRCAREANPSRRCGSRTKWSSRSGRAVGPSSSRSGRAVGPSSSRSGRAVGPAASLFALGLGLATAGCSDANLDAILAARRVLGSPTCSDLVRNGSETDVDCGGPTCARCEVGRTCAADGDCATACIQNRCWVPRTCAELHAQRPSLPSGTYVVAPTIADGQFVAHCDMKRAGGGWTRVAFEPAGAPLGRPDGGSPEGVEGGLAYLARKGVGTAEDVAMGTGTGLIGLRFAGAYEDVEIGWGEMYMRFTPAREIFANTVDLQIPLTNFATNDPLLNEWVLTAQGAMFCRASRFGDVRPGDTSWAVKPVTSLGSGCGCNDRIWLDRGAFYGGGVPFTSCSLNRGGGWSGVKDINEAKAGLASVADLSLWVR